MALENRVNDVVGMFSLLINGFPGSAEAHLEMALGFPGAVPDSVEAKITHGIDTMQDNFQTFLSNYKAQVIQEYKDEQEPKKEINTDYVMDKVFSIIGFVQSGAIVQAIKTIREIAVEIGNTNYGLRETKNKFDESYDFSRRNDNRLREDLEYLREGLERVRADSLELASELKETREKLLVSYNELIDANRTINFLSELLTHNNYSKSQINSMLAAIQAMSQISED